MDNVIKQITGFVGGLGAVLMAVLPVTILWYILTGGSVFGMDVVANLRTLITSLGNGGFVGRILRENIYYFTPLIENLYVIYSLLLLTIIFFILSLSIKISEIIKF